MRDSTKSCVYVASFFALSAYFFGSNDYISLILLVLSIVFLYPVILLGQMTIRNAAKTCFNEESGIYRFLSKKRTGFQMLLSLVLAIFLSISFLVIAKGLVLDHGFVPSVLIILFVTWVAGRLVTNKGLNDLESYHFDKRVTTAYNDRKNDDSQGKRASLDPMLYGSSFLSLFAAIFAINLVLALILSARELVVFLSADIDIDSFILYAEERSIPSLWANDYSRIFINIYLIMDSFKLAAANGILMAFDLRKDVGHGFFYGFYALVVFFNLLKLFAFSLPLVFLQRSLVVRGAPLLESMSVWFWNRGGRALYMLLRHHVDRSWRTTARLVGLGKKDEYPEAEANEDVEVETDIGDGERKRK